MIDKPIRAPGESLTMFAARLEVYDNRVETMRNAAPDLADALLRMLSIGRTFRSKPVGAPGSDARKLQDELIAIEDSALAALAKAGVL